MRSGKEHARQTEPSVQNESPAASGSTSRDNPTQQTVSELSVTQPTVPDTNGPSGSGPATGSVTESGTGIYQDVLVDCNALVEGYRKGVVSL